MGKHSIQENQKGKKEDKPTDAEKNRIKQDNKAKANPEQAARNKAINDAKRERRKASGSTKTFN